MCLVEGSQRALLIDTGMGIGTLRALVSELAVLPVIVVNSHTHPDHTCGNWQFNTIYNLDSDYARKNAKGSTGADYLLRADGLRVRFEVTRCGNSRRTHSFTTGHQRFSESVLKDGYLAWIFCNATSLGAPGAEPYSCFSFVWLPTAPASRPCSSSAAVRCAAQRPPRSVPRE